MLTYYLNEKQEILSIELNETHKLAKLLPVQLSLIEAKILKGFSTYDVITSPEVLTKIVETKDFQVSSNFPFILFTFCCKKDFQENILQTVSKNLLENFSLCSSP